MEKKSLDAKFTEARQRYYDADADHDEALRLCHCYLSSFKNPYTDTLHDATAELNRAALAFGPLIRTAIEAGHGGKWVQRRLPNGWRIGKTEQYTYCAYSHRGFYCADSGISDRDSCVQWLF